MKTLAEIESMHVAIAKENLGELVSSLEYHLADAYRHLDTICTVKLDIVTELRDIQENIRLLQCKLDTLLT